MKTTYLSRFSNPENLFCYHYEQLDEREKKLYRRLTDGLFAFQPSITLRGTTAETVETLYEKMKLDLPAAFFDEGIEMVWQPMLCLVKVKPRYRFSQQDAENILAEVMDRVQPLLLQCRGRTDLEKENLIHDWFCRNVTYDYNYAQNMGGSSFELAAPLLWGRGVCSGISKAAKFLFDLNGIRSLLLLGRTRNPDGAPGEDHCWLMVKIHESQPGGHQPGGHQPGGHPPAVRRYHLDITFDMTTKSRRYFNLTSREILADRVLTGPFA